ncbi:MAG: hypothetical protein ACK5KO_02980 [Arachnia sp.]
MTQHSLITRMRSCAAAASALCLAVVGAGCSSPSGADPTAGTLTWEGTIELSSSSVPPPGNWTKRAAWDGEAVDLEVSFWDADADIDGVDQPSLVAWASTLSQDQLAQASGLALSLESGDAEIPPGACTAIVELVSSAGDEVTASMPVTDERYETVTSLFTTLAGPENPALPQHSFECS